MARPKSEKTDPNQLHLTLTDKNAIRALSVCSREYAALKNCYPPSMAKITSIALIRMERAFMMDKNKRAGVVKAIERRPGNFTHVSTAEERQEAVSKLGPLDIEKDLS